MNASRPEAAPREGSVTGAGPGRRMAQATTPQMAAWAVFDWAASPFFTIIITFIFPAYFTRAVAADPVSGTAMWGWAMTSAALLIALLSPVLAAIADTGGRRKPWLAGFLLLAILPTVALWYVRPDPSYVLMALLLVVAADVANEIAQVFYNAMLPDMAPPQSIGRWSGWGWGLGYFAGIVALSITLIAFVRPAQPWFGLDKATAEHIRISGPFVALWLTVFALPLFLMVPDRPGSRLPLAESVRRGVGVLVATVRSLAHQPNIARFLIARLIYADGLNTLFAFGGIYAAGTFGMDESEVILFGIAINLAAGAGAFAFAFLDDHLGSKPTILIALVGLLGCGLAALLVTTKALFWPTGILLGTFVGPAQSASRTLMARLAPEHQRTEMFGIYALAGKVTAFMGPFLFGTATWWFSSQRAGMGTILILFVIGGGLLLTVREAKRER